MRERTVSGFAREFSGELLLFSGQYALFYIFMNFSLQGMGYFLDFGHTVLLAVLVLQTSVLVLFGKRPLVRLFGSLIAPAVYTMLEVREGMSFVLNMGHMFFWVFSIVTGMMQAFAFASRGRMTRRILEFLITVTNVAAFIVVYFYSDFELSMRDRLSAGAITREQMDALLRIDRLVPAITEFLGDPAHIYILVGGLVLAFSLAVGRLRILALNERISELFGRYVDGSIRDRIIATEDRNRSEKRNLAILFADIRNFTAVSEAHDAESITRMLNEYFSCWDLAVRAHHGIIDKYIGDAVMVVFGLERTESAAEDAVRCAFAMQGRFGALQSSLAEADLPVPKGFGVGIHYGEVILGDIGSAERRNFTVIGDAVNTASRLESLSKANRVSLLVSRAVVALLPAELAARFRTLGAATLRGKSRTVSVYALHSETDTERVSKDGRSPAVGTA